MRRAPYPLLALFLTACAQGGTGNGGVDSGVIGGGPDTGVDLMDGGGFVPTPDAGANDAGGVVRTDAGPPRDAGPPAECTTAAECDDTLACTEDACGPSGTCVNTPTDEDADGYGALGCGGGDDCDDAMDGVNPGATETCNGIDDDCSGAPDDTFACVFGAAPADCTTICGTPGTQPCQADCSLGACVAVAEVCDNDCDDDGNGTADDGCGPGAPPNDTCAGAVALTGGSGTLMATLEGATAQTTDCGGAEVFYSVTLAARSIVYLDTFGTGFDTRLSYRGAACPGTAAACEDDLCGTLQTQLAIVLEPGAHSFAVHADTGATAGTFSLRYQVLPAAGGDNIRISTSGAIVDSTSGASAVGATCGGSAGSGEDALWFTRCPGQTSSVSADSCFSESTYDTVLHARGGSGALGCSDDDFFCPVDQLSYLTFTAAGPGAFAIYVDGWSSSSTGSYGVRIGGL